MIGLLGIPPTSRNGERKSKVAVEAMEEPQINLRMSVSHLHCQCCLLPLKPPTFKCEAEHVLCSGCRGSHGQVCARAAKYTACVELDHVVRDAKVPCAYEEYGCTSWVVYYEASDHNRSCPFGPCFCPDPSCDFFSSPLRLAGHLASHHACPVTKFGYETPCKLAVPGPQDKLVLVGDADGSVFLVSSCALGAAMAVSLVRVSACGDAAAAPPLFRCKLWVEVEENLALVASMVATSDLSCGFAPTEQSMFLVVPPELLHDESGEAPALTICVDKVDGARSTSDTPPSRLPTKMLCSWVQKMQASVISGSSRDNMEFELPSN